MPIPLGHRLAFDADLTSAVLAAFLRNAFGFLRRKAREQGVVGGRFGAVPIVQQFGGSLNLSVHSTRSLSTA